jgi:catechol 2,3-dioxygenase-like lactoylglutathione lyase family enzyme
MPIKRLDHINISCTDLERSRRFYAEVLGLEDGERPNFKRAGAWMYQGGHPLVHLSTGRVPKTRSSDAFDHIAFRCVDLKEFESKLTAHSIKFEGYLVPDQHMYQLFFRDPDGAEIELIFDAEEGKSKLENAPNVDATMGRTT